MPIDTDLPLSIAAEPAGSRFGAGSRQLHGKATARPRFLLELTPPPRPWQCHGAAGAPRTPQSQYRARLALHGGSSGAVCLSRTRGRSLGVLGLPVPPSGRAVPGPMCPFLCNCWHLDGLLGRGHTHRGAPAAAPSASQGPFRAGGDPCVPGAATPAVCPVPPASATPAATAAPNGFTHFFSLLPFS